MGGGLEEGAGFADVRTNVQGPGEMGQCREEEAWLAKGIWGEWVYPSNLNPFSIHQYSSGFFFCPSPGLSQS